MGMQRCPATGYPRWSRGKTWLPTMLIKTPLLALLVWSLEIGSGDAAARPGSARDPPMVVIPGQGTIAGRELPFSRNQKAILYLNIPYAAAPVKDLRFALPQTNPLPYWGGVRNGSHFGPICWQDLDALRKFDPIFTEFLDDDVEMSEDCLSLNIFLPDGPPPPGGWPVMLWFHPGDFSTGAARLWDGSVLAVRHKVVIVTANYRLNIFGFFTTGDKAAPGNWGLWDQNAAIDWVRSKIATFGGNERNITIFGHGAGGVSVGLHVLAGEQKKFHAAIAMSGSGLSVQTFLPDAEIVRRVRQIASDFECEMSSNDTVICLRNIENATTVLSEGTTSENKVWGPVIDGTYATAPTPTFFSATLDHLVEKEGLRVPLMTGFTNHEDALTLPTTDINMMTFERLIGEEVATDITRLISPPSGDNEETSEQSYESPDALDLAFNETCTRSSVPLSDAAYFYYNPQPPTQDPTILRQKYIEFLTDRKYASHVYQQAVKHGKKNPAYVYRFDYRIKSSGVGGAALPDWVGVPHLYDLPFVWGMPYSTLFPTKVVWNSADKKIADTVMAIWTSFAKTGSPPPLTVKWDRINEENPAILIIDKAFNMSDQETVDLRAFSFWNDYYPKVLSSLNDCCNKTSAAVSLHLKFPSPLISEFYVHIPLLLPIVLVFY